MSAPSSSRNGPLCNAAHRCRACDCGRGADMVLPPTGKIVAGTLAVSAMNPGPRPEFGADPAAKAVPVRHLQDALETLNALLGIGRAASRSCSFIVEFARRKCRPARENDEPKLSVSSGLSVISDSSSPGSHISRRDVVQLVVDDIALLLQEFRPEKLVCA